MYPQSHPHPRISDEMLAAQNLWNASQHQQGQPVTLAGLDLSGIELSGLDLGDAIFSASNLRHAQAVATRLPSALLAHAILENANLTLANLVKATLNHAIFDGATLTGADLAKAIAYGTSFQRADLRGARVVALRTGMGASFRSADLRDADLTDIRLNGVDFTGIDLRGAKGIETIRLAKDVTIGDRVLSGPDFIAWAQQEAARA